MKTQNTPAFPNTIVNDHGVIITGHKGMTLRDYFAAKAMQNLINIENLKGGKNDYIIISRHAYCCADAMLKQREL